MAVLFPGLMALLSILGVLFVISRLFMRRCDVYRYIEVDGKRIPVAVGYIKSDGSIIDTSRKLPDRQHVGQVTMREEKGRVLLYFTETGEGQKEEVGYVDLDGNVFTSSDQNLGKVSTDGKRNWWELWLRRHAEVPTETEEPIGKCVESLRLHSRKPNELTLLARGGAALLLYYVKVKAGDEVPRVAPHVLWDTALPASFLFSVLFILPGFVPFVEDHEMLLGFLGPTISYVATAFGLFLMIWLLLHFLKTICLYFNDEILYYFTMLNQQTGIRSWTLVGAVIALIGFVEAISQRSTEYLPLYLAVFLGLCLVYFRAQGAPWPVKARSRGGSAQTQTAPAGAGNIKREFSWDLVSPFKTLSLSAEVRFQDDEIEQVRKTNPFYENWQQAANDSRVVAATLVQNGGSAPQAQAIVGYMKDIARQNRLTAFEELQLALNFVQSPNINYELDENCEEILNRPEYFRLPAETLFDKRGDCDCKSVLAATLMKNLGYPVLLLLSSKAEHAAIAVGGAPGASDDDLFFFEHKGEHYYYCETTGAGWKIGQETDDARVIRSDPAAVVDLTL